jgi:hypothetical protein
MALAENWRDYVDLLGTYNDGPILPGFTSFYGAFMQGYPQAQEEVVGPHMLCQNYNANGDPASNVFGPVMQNCPARATFPGKTWVLAEDVQQVYIDDGTGVPHGHHPWLGELNPRPRWAIIESIVDTSVQPAFRCGAPDENFNPTTGLFGGCVNEGAGIVVETRTNRTDNVPSELYLIKDQFASRTLMPAPSGSFDGDSPLADFVWDFEDARTATLIVQTAGVAHRIFFESALLVYLFYDINVGGDGGDGDPLGSAHIGPPRRGVNTEASLPD